MLNVLVFLIAAAAFPISFYVSFYVHSQLILQINCKKNSQTFVQRIEVDT